MNTNYFKDKKITVVGLGLLGRGVGDAVYIAEMGAAEVLVTDLKTEAELKNSVDQLRDFENVTFVFGEHREEDFVGRDLILVSADVPLDSPYLAAARAAGVPLRRSADLFAEIAGIPVIGVTGTRGKSTVTNMIHHVLSMVTGEHIILGGNIRGVSNLQLLNEVEPESIAVMELDSWQLQGWGWAKMSPQIAVFTNFMEDHLNYYSKGGKTTAEAIELYFADKANVFINQDETGVLVTTPAVFEAARRFASGRQVTLGQEVVLVDGSTLPEDTVVPIPGEHNKTNAALAYEALKALSLTDEEILPALAIFPGVEGRLQRVGECNGAPVYNDNNATTPVATAAGIRAVATDRNVVLLCGGSDKDLPLTELITEINTHCTHVVLYSGTGTEKLKAALGNDVSFEEHGVFTEAVEAFLASLTPATVGLFSPGFASFGKEFRNEYDRNDLFLDCVKKFLNIDR